MNRYIGRNRTPVHKSDESGVVNVSGRGEGRLTQRPFRLERAARDGRGTMEFDLIRRMGVIVQDVPGLCTPASYIAEINLVVVRAELDHPAREHCAEYLLSEVLPALTPSPVE